MTVIRITPESTLDDDTAIKVDQYEGMVHLDVHEDAGSIYPDDARALAAVLIAQAEAAER